MRATLLVLASVLALAAVAAPAAADVTVDRLPVYGCIADVCTPCPDPVTVPAPITVRFEGADC